MPDLVLEIKEPFLEVNKVIPLTESQIPEELEFELLRCYLSLDTCLLEQVKRASAATRKARPR